VGDTEKIDPREVYRKLIKGISCCAIRSTLTSLPSKRIPLNLEILLLMIVTGTKPRDSYEETLKHLNKVLSKSEQLHSKHLPAYIEPYILTKEESNRLEALFRVYKEELDELVAYQEVVLPKILGWRSTKGLVCSLYLPGANFGSLYYFGGENKQEIHDFYTLHSLKGLIEGLKSAGDEIWLWFKCDLVFYLCEGGDGSGTVRLLSQLEKELYEFSSDYPDYAVCSKGELILAHNCMPLPATFAERTFIRKGRWCYFDSFHDYVSVTPEKRRVVIYDPTRLLHCPSIHHPKRYFDHLERLEHPFSASVEGRVRNLTEHFRRSGAFGVYERLYEEFEFGFGKSEL
jgi:hypothetical protein